MIRGVRTVLASVAISATMLVAGEARADPPELRYDTAIDVSVTAGAGLAWMLSEAFKDNLVPRHCRWCYRAEDGTDLLNPIDAGIRRSFLWTHTRAADFTSSILAFVVQPLAVTGAGLGAAAFDGGVSGYPVDLLLVAEATMIAAVVNQGAKYAFARERPFVHFLPQAPDEVRKLTPSPTDDNLSFYSGHTTLAFVLATSAGMIASLRRYELAPVVWGVGMPIAAAVGYLRIAADKHYFSDVMTAAIIGSAIGVGVPLLFHAPRTSGDGASAPPTPPPPGTPAAFSLGGTF